MATKISLKQLSDEVLALLGGGGALSKEIISNVAVGAAASGTKFPKGQTLQEFAETLLRKDITPTISTSFSGSGIKEKGTSVNGTTMVLNITNTSAVTVPINKIEFYEGNTLLDSQNYTAGKTSYSYVYNKTISSDKTFKAILTYNGSSKSQGTGSFTFIYGRFYGTTKLATIDAAAANSLLSSFTKEINNSKAFTWNNITLNDARFCYMYPASLGNLSSIKDGNGFSQIEGYTKYSVNITYPTTGDSVAYNVYLLKDSATGTGFTQIYT